MTEVLFREKVEKSPLLVFDEVPGYAKGMRCIYGMLGSPVRLGLALGMDVSAAHGRMAMLNLYREKMEAHEPVAPRIDSFPRVAQTSRELAAEVRERFPDAFG